MWSYISDLREFLFLREALLSIDNTLLILLLRQTVLGSTKMGYMSAFEERVYFNTLNHNKMYIIGQRMTKCKLEKELIALKDNGWKEIIKRGAEINKKENDKKKIKGKS